MQDEPLLPDEELTDLDGRVKIIQKKDGFRFGTDAVLLARFANVNPYEQVADLGTGSGILCFLLHQKCPEARFTGVEIQKEIAGMAARSVVRAGLEERVEIVWGDVRSFAKGEGQGSFDAVVCNPPYRPLGTGLESGNDQLRISRCEVNGGVREIVLAASRLLRFGGRLYMVYRPQRLCDLLCAMREVHLEPKRLQFVHPLKNMAPALVLVEGRRGGGVELKVDPPLILEENNHETN